MTHFKIVYDKDLKVLSATVQSPGDWSAPTGCGVAVVEADTKDQALAKWRAPILTADELKEEQAKHAAQQADAMGKIIEEAVVEDTVRGLTTFEDFMALSDQERWSTAFMLLKRLQEDIKSADLQKKYESAAPPFVK